MHHPSATSRTDQALSAGESALDSTRQLATHALDAAGEKVRDLRHGARDFASRSIDTVSGTALAAQRQIGRYADVTGRYVSEQPVKSALIAAAIGALVAGAVMLARRRNHHDGY
jgi:ElaB/YqjD/DUF883 family membrane-anchored ribosome-binding protein